jgi:hypothetical protein
MVTKLIEFKIVKRLLRILIKIQNEKKKLEIRIVSEIIYILSKVITNF